KLRIACTPAATTVLTTGCAASAGTAITAMPIPSRLTIFRKSRASGISTPPRERLPAFFLRGSHRATHSEPAAPKARVVGQRETEIARAHDRDADAAIQPEDLAQVPPQLLDVVADAADAELAEVRQILADLRRIEVELLGERLGGDRADAIGIERVQ